MIRALHRLREPLSRVFAWAAINTEPPARTTVIRMYRVDRQDGKMADRIEIMSPEGVQVFHESVLHPIAVNPGVPLILEHSYDTAVD